MSFGTQKTTCTLFFRHMRYFGTWAEAQARTHNKKSWADTVEDDEEDPNEWLLEKTPFDFIHPSLHRSGDIYNDYGKNISAQQRRQDNYSEWKLVIY